MASTRDFIKIDLTAEDIPGAKLDINKLEDYSNMQLKRWLECRGIKSSGNRTELLKRCNDVINSGRVDQIDINIDQGKWYDIKLGKVKPESVKKNQPAIPPVLGWKTFPSRPIPVNFNYGHIYHYLLESVVLLGEDGKQEDTDLSHMTSKPLTKGEQYVKSGSVTNIMDNSKGSDLYFIKGKVDASMRKEHRIVHITLSSISGAVLDASCTCPASCLGRCNHVAALLLMLNKHCKESGYDATACTSKPCEWNQGKKSNKNPSKITEAAYSYYKSRPKKLSTFDPRPQNQRNISKETKNSFIMEMQYNSLRTSKPSMWGTLLSSQYEDYSLEEERVDQLESLFWIMFDNLRDEGKQYPTAAYMIPNTEQQSESDTWKSNRWFRITASTSKQASNLGNILNTETQYCDSTKRKLFNFISYNIWALHTFSTPDTVYGIESEEQARADYLKYMAGKIQDFRVIKTGFWINKLWPEIGCSPDGLVFDPEENMKYGLLELKCPKLFRKVAPSDLFMALKDKKILNSELYSACFSRPTSENASLELKTHHAYYYQIQLQLAVTGLEWCDFVLWSSLGKPNVERIRRDQQLITSMIGNITTLWRRVIAPELFEMRVPRKLFPIILKDINTPVILQVNK
ncbi:uncharacterized protein [Mytilus edulis]|uniref:uncharacterized protein n=1 Tax=Mytilus edulis TaxID=6550 RepID=UPI0039EE03E6